MLEEKKIASLRKWGLIFAYVAVSVFIIGTTIAMIFYSNYQFNKGYFSELGSRAYIDTGLGEIFQE